MKYKLKCKQCKKETPHLITTLSRLRGVRLRCSKCGTQTATYHKVKYLERIK